MKLTEVEKAALKRISEETPVSFYDVRRIYEYRSKSIAQTKKYIKYALASGQDPVMLAAIGGMTGSGL